MGASSWTRNFLRCRPTYCRCKGHIADEAEAPRGSLGRLWRIQRQDQAKPHFHPCARQPHVGRAQRRARRYVGAGGGDEDWSNFCQIVLLYTSNVLYVTIPTM